MNEQCILVVDDDAVITEALSLTLEQPGRTVVVCSDVVAAEIALSTHPVTHLVSDVQFSGEFGFEGLHFLARVRTLAPQCRIVLMTGAWSEALVKAAKSFGAAEVLSKPFDINTLERALNVATVHEGHAYEILRVPPLDEILNSDELTTAFQPIVRMTADGVMPFGFEALARVRGEWLESGPSVLFEYAKRLDRLADLNIASLTRSIHAAADLPGHPVVFVNVDPVTFSEGKLIRSLQEASRRAGVALSRIVLEVTERSAFPNDDATLGIFDELRADGIRYALDDHGSAYSHLAVISRIRPSFMKISNTFGTAFEQDEIKKSIVRHMVVLAHDLGCETILEGIESAATASAAAQTGVDLLQGFHLGRPNPVSHWMTP